MDATVEMSAAEKGLQRLVTLAAWTTLVLLACLTLGRPGLLYAVYFKAAPWIGHPTMTAFAAIEHLIAFTIVGALLLLAYPRHLLFVSCMVLIAAVGLEFLQTLTPDRHGTVLDAVEKIVGGWLGVFGACVTLWMRRSRAFSCQYPSLVACTQVGIHCAIRPGC